LLIDDLKKISVALEDRIYEQLFDYAAAKSRRMRSRFSVSESASELISTALEGTPCEETFNVNK
jgi:hypothetical protein